MGTAAEDEEAACEAACQQLSDPKHLVRERAWKRLLSLLQQPKDADYSGPGNIAQRVWTTACQLLASTAWEAKLGGLAACKVLAQHQPAAVADQLPHMLSRCISLLEDEEPRVRTAVAELLGVLSQQYECGTVWGAAGPPILDSIHRNFDRDALVPDPPSATTNGAAGISHPHAADNNLAASTATTAANGHAATGANGTTVQAAAPGNLPAEGERTLHHGGVATASAAGARQQADGVAIAALRRPASPSLMNSLLDEAYKPLVPGQGDMRHGTEGWRSLETSLKAVLAISQGGGSRWAPFATTTLLDLVCRCMHHPNRYVREASHLLVAALCEAIQPVEATPTQHCGVPADSSITDDSSNGTSNGHATPSSLKQSNGVLSHTPQGTDLHNAALVSPVEPSSDQPISLEQLAVRTAGLLADGLTDNWSQVRYPACLGARALLLAAQRSPQHVSLMSQVLPVLLPPLCLNRYYVADGVRAAAQETWRTVMQDQGRHAVALHIDQVCKYYIAQSKAVHHGVREAACACIAELAEKVDSNVVVPHMPDLLRALLVCCKDMAWPVRDAGCVAAGRCARALPAACEPFLEQYLQLWVAHLWDNVQSVRTNSACALIDALAGYPDNPVVLETIHKAIRDMLPKATKKKKLIYRGRTTGRSTVSSRQNTRSPAPSSTPSKQQEPSEPAAAAQEEQPMSAQQEQSMTAAAQQEPQEPAISEGAQQEQPSTAAVRQDTEMKCDASRQDEPVQISFKPAGTPTSLGAQLRAQRGFGRSRSPSPSAGRPLSPARIMEQRIKLVSFLLASHIASPSDYLSTPSMLLQSALALDPDMFRFGMEDMDMDMFSESTAQRFSTSSYIRGDGCMDFGFSRDQEPWEATDGATFLVAELACAKPKEAEQHLSGLATYVAGATRFTAADKLRETLWRVFPRIARALGKQSLKRHLELFLPAMFDDLNCGTQLTEVAAGKAVAALRDYLGPNILAARLTDFQVQMLRTSPTIPPPTVDRAF